MTGDQREIVTSRVRTLLASSCSKTSSLESAVTRIVQVPGLDGARKVKVMVEECPGSRAGTSLFPWARVPPPPTTD